MGIKKPLPGERRSRFGAGRLFQDCQKYSFIIIFCQILKKSRAGFHALDQIEAKIDHLVLGY